MSKMFYGGFSQQKGSAGDYTFRLVKGETIVSRRVAKRGKATSTPGRYSAGQLAQMAKFGNVVNAWRVSGGVLKEAFREYGLVTSYNDFVGRNSGSAAPEAYLTANQIAQGGVVLLDWFVSQGILPAVQISQPAAGQYVSNINMPEAWDGTASVDSLTQSLLALNPSLRNGDQISALIFTQYSDGNGVPRVSVRAEKLVLRLGSTDVVNDLVSLRYFSSVAGSLGTSESLGTGGFCYIVSRIVDEQLQVSSQSIVTNNSEMQFLYGSNNVKASSADSYGGAKEDVFLNPGSVVSYVSEGEGGSGADVQPTFTSVQVLNSSGGTIVSQTTTQQVTIPAGQTTIVIAGSNLNNVSAVSARIGSNTVAFDVTSASSTEVRASANVSQSGTLYSVSAGNYVVRNYTAASGGDDTGGGGLG